MLVAIVGGPGSGKTTLSKKLSKQLKDTNIVHTDDFMHYGWEEQPQRIEEAASQGNTIVEGVQAVRWLRKLGKEPDMVLYLKGSHKELTPRAKGLGKTVEKVFEDWISTTQDKYDTTDSSEIQTMIRKDSYYGRT